MNSVTRGHHGAGKHVRPKRPRSAYGPRDSARRAEWLKTDEGRAWSARQRPTAAKDSAKKTEVTAPKKEEAPPTEKKPVERASFTGKVTGSWLNAESERNAARVAELFGEERLGLRRGEAVTPQALGRLAGAPDGSRVLVECDFTEADGREDSYDEARITLTIKHPFISQMDRRIDIYQDFDRTVSGAVCTNENLFLKPNAPAGFGTDIFLQQVDTLSRARFETIETTGIGTGRGLAAAEENARNRGNDGSTGSANKPTLGYYVWPRMGYDANIPYSVEQRLPEQYRKARTVRDLMKLPGGIQWWKYNGEGTQFTFDLRPGSESIKIARAYAAERRAATATKSILAYASSLGRARTSAVDIDAAKVVQRGHHGAGKHERPKKERGKYGSTGPRDPAQRAAWLQTDEGKAYAQRQQEKEAAAKARAQRAATRTKPAAPVVPSDEDERARWIEDTDEGKRWHDQQIADRQARAQAAARASGKAESGEEFVERLKALRLQSKADDAAFHAASDRAAELATIKRNAEKEVSEVYSTLRQPDGLPIGFWQARRQLSERLGVSLAVLDGVEAPPRLSPEAERDPTWVGLRPKLQKLYEANVDFDAAHNEYSRLYSERGQREQRALVGAYKELLEDAPTWTSLKAPAPGREEAQVWAQEGLTGPTARGGRGQWFDERSATRATDFVSRALGPVAAERLYAKDENALGWARYGAYDRDVTRAGHVTRVPGAASENLDVVSWRRAESGRSEYLSPLAAPDIDPSQPRRPLMRAVIKIRSGATTETYIHELGHHLEERHRDIYATLQRWKEARTAGESATWLGAGFDRNEVAKRDQFVDKYIGKEYGRKRASEILSVGLEALYSNPWKLIESDPDYVATLYSALKGVPKARSASNPTKGYLEVIDEAIRAAGFITRGHHGAGKHVRARRPRLAYGPRDAARRNEWLKTEAGKAWAERQAARASSSSDEKKPRVEPKPLGDNTFTGKITGEWLDANTQEQVALAINRHGNSAFGLKAGESLTPEYFGRLTGAPDGAHVTALVQLSRSGAVRALVKVEHESILRCTRALDFDETGQPKEVENMNFFLRSEAPAGFGTSMFLQQVQELSRRGFSTIKTEGVGSGTAVRRNDEQNARNLAEGRPKLDGKPTLGFYVWPRLGYDAPLTDADQARIKAVAPQFADAATVRDLMKLPGGAQWWKYNGSGRRYAFDLTPNSESMKIAAAYVQERKAVTGTKSYFNSRAGIDAANRARLIVIPKALSVPPWMRANAARGIAWYEEGKAGDGIRPETVRDARAMQRGAITANKVVRMAAWFARHMVDLDAPAARVGHPDYPSAGVVAHALWGGGSRTESARAMSWAQARAREIRGNASINENSRGAGS